MSLRDQDDLDDAAFDLADVRVVDGRVCLRGHVEEPVPGLGRARRAVRLTVDAAVAVAVDDATGTGELVLERVDVSETHVTLVGVAPCTVTITTSRRSAALFDLVDVPVAVRRWVAGARGPDVWQLLRRPVSCGGACGRRRARPARTRRRSLPARAPTPDRTAVSASTRSSTARHPRVADSARASSPRPCRPRPPGGARRATEPAVRTA